MSLAYEQAAAGGAAGPSPTRDLTQGLRNIAEYGLTIVPDVLVGDQLARARDALYRAAESDRARGRDRKNRVAISRSWTGGSFNNRCAGAFGRR